MSPAAQCDRQTPELVQYTMKLSLAAQVMSIWPHSGHSRQGQLHCEVESHVILCGSVTDVLFFLRVYNTQL